MSLAVVSRATGGHQTDKIFYIFFTTLIDALIKCNDDKLNVFNSVCVY